MVIWTNFGLLFCYIISFVQSHDLGGILKQIFFTRTESKRYFLEGVFFKALLSLVLIYKKNVTYHLMVFSSWVHLNQFTYAMNRFILHAISGCLFVVW